MLAFFSGFPAEGTMGATMIYSIPGFHRPGASLCAPEGGTQAVVDKLTYCLEKFGGELQLKSHVEEIIVQDGEAKGVRLKNGKVIKARNAVVSNATIWDTVPMLPDAEVLKAQQLDRSVEWKEEMSEIPELGSIMHLFLGIDATGLPDLDPSHICIRDWNRPLGDPQNVVTIFIPTVLDPDAALGRNTSFTSTPPVQSRTTFGKKNKEARKITKILNANERKFYGKPWSASSRTFASAWKLKFMPPLKPTNGFYDATKVRTVRLYKLAVTYSTCCRYQTSPNRAY